MFYRAIASQIPIDEHGTAMDHVNLRTSVSDFAIETKCDAIEKLRESYEQVIGVASDKSWLGYWTEARRPGEWVDYIFIQVTASYLLRDIIIVTTSSTVTNPFILISGDRQEDMKATGPAIIIGMKTNIHFQSLLSVGQHLPLRYPELPSNPITLTLEHLGELFIMISSGSYCGLMSLLWAKLYHSFLTQFIRTSFLVCYMPLLIKES